MKSYEELREQAKKELTTKKGKATMEKFLSNPEKAFAWLEKKEKAARNPAKKKVYAEVIKKIESELSYA
jgi:hypothetical protein